MQVFYAVAKHGSFTRAADSLFMTQPAVTFQIKQLEEHFNCRLFERQHQKIALTSAGELVLGFAEKILALSDEMEGRVAELTGQMGGKLDIGASTTLGEFILPNILSQFNELFPQVHLRMVVGNSDQIQSSVIEGALDIGLIDCPSPNKAVNAEAVGGETLAVVCAKSYPLADMTSVKVADLPEYEYVSREPGSGTRECIEAYLKANDISPDQLKMVMELGSPEALKNVVQTGLGFALMSPSVVRKEIERGELVALALDPPIERRFSLITPKERFRSRTISAFCDYVKTSLLKL
jgi:DNA-binding transcriptional LysR family regulator